MCANHPSSTAIEVVSSASPKIQAQRKEKVRTLKSENQPIYSLSLLRKAGASSWGQDESNRSAVSTGCSLSTSSLSPSYSGQHGDEDAYECIDDNTQKTKVSEGAREICLRAPRFKVDPNRSDSKADPQKYQTHNKKQRQNNTTTTSIEVVGFVLVGTLCLGPIGSVFGIVIGGYSTNLLSTSKH